MSDLDRSAEYFRKQSLLSDNIVPKQTEIRGRLGDDLTAVLFETCMPALKPYLGLVPVLAGPGDDLWVSPSDLLIGKVRLKPPLTNKYVKALTHQGILEIGAVIEKKAQTEHEIDVKKAVVENEEIVKYMAEKEKIKAVGQAKDEERIKYERIIGFLLDQFTETLTEELTALEEKLEIEKNYAVNEAKTEMKELMQERMELAILETVQRLVEQFGTELLRQSTKLHAHFWYHMKQEKKKLKKAVAEEKSRHKAMIQKLRHEMQCENIANVMYILAIERRRYRFEKQRIQDDFFGKLAALEEELVVRVAHLQKLTVENEENARKLHAREQYLYEIIKQFQKFIYFVLRAVPTQAEYLLNVEKLMIFELTKTLLDTKPELFDSNNPLTVIRSVGNVTPTVSSQRSREMGLVAPDFHNCENMVEVIDSSHTLSSNEDLPMFVFNEKTYIREDFRNMISQGLQISQSNELWSRDIENLAYSLQPDFSVEPVLISDTSLTQDSQSKEPNDDKLATQSSQRILHDTDLRTKSSDKVDLVNAQGSSNKLADASGSLPLTIEKFETEKSANNVDTKAKSNQPELSCYYDANLEKETRPCCKSTKPKKAVKTSTFDSHIDSLILITRKMFGSKVSTTKNVLEVRRPSKLSLAVDSLTLLRSKESLKVKSNSSVMEKASSSSAVRRRRELRNVGVQCERVVKLSHIEVIPPDGKKGTSAVSFHILPRIIPSVSVSTVFEESDAQLVAQSKLDGDLSDKPNQAKVMGDLTASEHMQGHDEFTIKRINSLLSIFRKHPSLRDLFTEASKN